MWRGSGGFGGQEIVTRIFCMKANYFQQKLAKKMKLMYIYVEEDFIMKKTFKYVVTFLMGSAEISDIFFFILGIK